MSITEIDYLATDFYKATSFQNEETPDFTPLKILFYGEGILVNNSFGKPITYTAATFIQALELQIELGKLLQFMQRELHSQTEIFGKVAQRISVYEYSFDYHERTSIRKGINYIQFIQENDTWLISSMAWNDENENYKVPSELAGH